jgi:hypothetical protein
MTVNIVFLSIIWLQVLDVHGSSSLFSVTFHVMAYCGLTSGDEIFESECCLHLQDFNRKNDNLLISVHIPVNPNLLLYRCRLLETFLPHYLYSL